MKENPALKVDILEVNLKKLENLHASFDYVKISLASPKKIRSWAERVFPDGQICGEVNRPDTINFRTHKPETAGLFCQKIFGPIKNWTCACGKYSNYFFENLNKICEKCNVEITESRIRRYRMGYIELMCPVVHFWYIKGTPNYILTLLKCYSQNLKASDLEQIVYFKEGFRIINPENPLYSFFAPRTGSENSLINNLIETKLLTKTKINSISPQIKGNRIGAEIIKSALDCLPLKAEIKRARAILHFVSTTPFYSSTNLDKTLIRRIRILENFIATKTNPSWMILTSLPVLPPSLRPLIELENGKLVASDINEIYKLIITRNQRLLEFLYKYDFPNFLSIYVRKLLQEGVDALIDNAKLPKNKRLLLNNKPLKSLSEVLEGKYGRFRHSLLGKRVDFSGRSIIIVNPALRLNQCGIPYEIASQLFEPFLINELMKLKEIYFNKKLVNLIIKKRRPFIWILLNQLIQKYNILLNRAPTLHRFGIQAFDPILVLGQAIQLHPLVCTGFNADFDGDQMAIHLPLSYGSQLEAKLMMRPAYNILSPSNGDVMLKPTQDMVIGCYYLTFMLNKINSSYKKWFKDEEEALLAFNQKKLELHTPILIRYPIENFNLLTKQSEFLIRMKNSYDTEFKKIIIYKILKNTNSSLYLLSNMGVIILKELTNCTYILTHCFIESTAGRLIFSKNLQNLYKHTSYLKK